MDIAESHLRRLDNDSDGKNVDAVLRGRQREEERKHKKTKQRAAVAWLRLRSLPRLINQAIGDGISGLLLVDAILKIRRWTVRDWDNTDCNTYEDVPSCQMKVSVPDRHAIVTNEDETRTVSPAGLQCAIDDAVSKADSKLSFKIEEQHSPSSRAFVRPSGTEDAVRIYAEVPGNGKEANLLAKEVAGIVHQYCSSSAVSNTTIRLDGRGGQMGISQL